jgi:signal transduction histidine kinase
VQQAVTQLEPPSGVALEVAVDGELELLVDPDQMVRALLALLRNAVDAVEGAGRVRLGARRLEGRIEVRVEDQGPGVPAELRERIFEPLFTTHRRRPGLGLALAHSVVTAHGGDLGVQTSESLGGACFVLSLPAG